MSKLESPSSLITTSTAVKVHTEQPVSAPGVEEVDQSNAFYLIGGIINITMITAYFIWAFGAWKKADKRKGQ